MNRKKKWWNMIKLIHTQNALEGEKQWKDKEREIIKNTFES